MTSVSAQHRRRRQTISRQRRKALMHRRTALSSGLVVFLSKLKTGWSSREATSGRGGMERKTTATAFGAVKIAQNLAPAVGKIAPQVWR